MIRDSKQLQIGKAGEYLVCADLILKGFIAFPSEQGLPYDVLLDTGEKLLKIQVKTTEKPRVLQQERKSKIPAYMFSIKRAGHDGKTRYNENEIDIFALVCLETTK
ncbi:MAG: group I intron-associated PD-(D/E)XK endonuclease, partial [Bacteroidota bacterium]